MVAQCVTPIKGRVMRLIKLDTCGNPVTGASSAMVISKGFISVKAKPDYEDGTEYLQRLADGSFCVNQKDPGQLKRFSLESLWCVMDPDAIVIQTGQRLLSTSGTGTGVAYNESLQSARYSLEVWQEVTGRNACSATGQQQFVYWAWPNLGNAQLGDWTIELASLQFTTTAETQPVGSRWGTGTGWGTSWLPGALNPDEHAAWNITTNAPPTPSCGATALSG